MISGLRDLSFLGIFLVLYVSGGYAALNIHQRSALIQLYNSTGGDTWTYDPTGITRESKYIVPWDVYNASSDPCADKWSGVICFHSSRTRCVDNDSGECFVGQLILEYFNMTGSLLVGQFMNLYTLVEVSHTLFPFLVFRR